ncbi:sodium-dependent glucose transporter 1-like [Mercenaria mercenaria]|uniref:sodium-dependent glucose transporter 1-like n=1 Tax=Mercenaria mercenaria TaxID=6596 RepID=UPI00234E4793|nr:sodium-dependent glucose transporter 1-like [Mercenaria mercenaria]
MQTGSENACEISSRYSSDSQGIMVRLRKDSLYRKKLVLTLAVFWTYVILGWVILQIGTALPDLQVLISIDLETASWIFSTWSIGYMGGSLVCGVLYDKINRLFLMFVCASGTSVCSFCLPQFKSFTVIIVFRALTGIFCGGLDTGANTIIPSTWGSDAGPAMQALYLCYSIGGIVSPLATEPFMSPKQNKESAENDDLNIYRNNYTTFSKTDIFEQNDVNSTYSKNFSEQAQIINATSDQFNMSTDSMYNGNIDKAFVLTSGLVLSSAIPFLVMLIIGGYDHTITSLASSTDNTHEESDPLQEKPDVINLKERLTNKIKGKRKILVLAFVAGINLVYSATEDSLGDFLVTFSLHYLEWENSSSVTLVSLYWVISCIGGLGGVFLAKTFRPAKLLLISHLLWIASFLVALLASLYRIDIMLWIFISGSGLFMTLIIPAIISWTEENVSHITGRISSLFMIATGCGIAANPMFIGYMMGQYTYVSFLYILFFESILCFGFYILAVVSRYVRNSDDRDVKLEIVKSETADRSQKRE